MKVMKFGGSVLHHEAGFQAMVDIVQKQDGKHVIVISAFSDITRRLDAAMLMALQQSYEIALQEIHSIVNYHAMLASSLISKSVDFRSVLEQTSMLFQRVLKGISLTKEISPKIRDYVLSQGEHLSTAFVKELLQSHGINVGLIDAGDIMLTDSVHGHAKPLESLIGSQIHSIVLPAFQKYDIIIIAGFIGKNAQGDITSMGYESSNLTASLIGSLIQAEEIIIWTDVSGIRTADPKYIVNTHGIPALEYTEARELAQNGLKLLHHWMLDVPMKYAVPVCIANAYDDLGEKTIISHGHSKESPTIIIRHTQDIDDFSHIFDMDATELTRVSVFTLDRNIIQAIYSLAANISMQRKIIIRTFESQNMHHIIMEKSDADYVMNTLHSMIEERS